MKNVYHMHLFKLSGTSCVTGAHTHFEGLAKNGHIPSDICAVVQERGGPDILNLRESTKPLNNYALFHKKYV